VSGKVFPRAEGWRISKECRNRERYGEESAWMGGEESSVESRELSTEKS